MDLHDWNTNIHLDCSHCVRDHSFLNYFLEDIFLNPHKFRKLVEYHFE